MSAQAAAAATDAPAPKGSKKKLVMIVIAVALLAAGSGGGWYWSQSRKAAENGAEAKPALKKPAIFMQMDLYTVNLRSDDVDQLLQIGMNLQLESTDAQKAVTESLPVIRSRILLLLSTKKSGQLMQREGKVELAAEVLEEIRHVIGPAGKEVAAVHFSAFVIQ